MNTSLPNDTSAGTGAHAAITVDHLVKRYGDRNVVDDVSFRADRGEIFGIVGPNGAGKTTTVESVIGLRRPDSETIRALGYDPLSDHDELTRHVGVQLQESRLQDRIRAGEALELYASFYADPADPGELLQRFGLQELVDQRYSTLSGGQQQRLAVAIALVGTPDIAVLDELTTGLDPEARHAMWDTVETIRDAGVTVVLVTHFMEEAERLCDRIMVVDHGRAVAIDTPAGLLRRAGTEQTLRFHPSRPVDDAELADLPGVVGVRHTGTRLEVVGTDELVTSVTAYLARHRVIAEDLRIEQHDLEDAYLALTGATADDMESDR